jgi:ABC-type lipoprotein release transport system permease subunit
VGVSGIAYRFRAELRGRWPGWVALGALIGVVGAMVIVLAAGARRTDSAHDRFLADAHAYDVGLITACGANVDPSQEPEPGCREEVARLPAVADATVLTQIPAVVTDAEGRLVQPGREDPCWSGPGQVGVYLDQSGHFGSDINRHRFVAGRRADPSRADEVEVSAHIANLFGLKPGSELGINLLRDGDCTAELDPSDAIRVRVVGVQLSPGEVAPPTGLFIQTVGVTRAFADAAGSLPHSDHLAVRLRPGESVESLQAQATDAGYTAFAVVSRADNAEAIDRAISPTAVSLRVLALMFALAGMAIVGQLLVRHAAVVAADEPTLASLGMSRKRRFVLGMLRATIVAATATVVAVVVGILVSPLMPVGLARTVEPDRGFDVDGLVFLLGAAGTFLFVIAVSAIPVWRATASAVPAQAHRAATTRAALVTRAARAGFSPVAVSGARFALERGSGGAAVPVVSSFIGLAIAIAAIVGALTFGTNLTHLRSSPALTGWNWDVIVPLPEPGDSVPSEDMKARVRAALDEHPGVAQYAGGVIWNPFPQGRSPRAEPAGIDFTGFAAFDGGAAFGPSVISGRRPQAAHEILVGAHTLAELNARIGDEFDVIGQDGTWEEPGPETRVRMRIVGTGVIPITDRLGRGMAITVEGARLLNDRAEEQGFFVRLRPGTDRESLLDAVRRAVPEAAAEGVDLFGGEDVSDPSLNLNQISAVPGLFATLLGVLAAAVMVHVLSAATRARRRDLGVLRALGFSRGQAMRAVAYQAAIYAALALAVAIPVGIAIGRAAWREYAANLYVVPETVTSWRMCIAVAAITLAVTVLIALPPGWFAARRRPAAVLRTE